MTKSNILEMIEQAHKGGWKNLNLGGYKLTSLPPEIGNLTNLTELILFENELTSLPPQIGNLTNLTRLILQKNKLTTFPLEIGNLTNLEVLNLSENELTSLSPEIGNLINLISLSLRGNKLTTLLPQIGNLTNLEVLVLFGNELTSLPPQIGNLTNLKELYLFGNELTSLPPQIGNLTNLTGLNLRNNKLTTLPLEIGNLTNLTELNLRNNKLTTLPLEIGNLKNIENILLDGNPLNLPESIYKAGYEAIIAYFSVQRNKLLERITIEFKNELWGQLFPIELALSKTIGDQYIIEKSTEKIIVSLESMEQLQNALDAVITVLAALEKAAPNEVKSLEIEQRNHNPEKIEGAELQNSLSKIYEMVENISDTVNKLSSIQSSSVKLVSEANNKLDKILDDKNKLTPIEQSGVDLVKGTPIVGPMMGSWFETFIKRQKQTPNNTLTKDIYIPFKRFFVAAKGLPGTPCL